jgi:hypothetical protein
MSVLVPPPLRTTLNYTGGSRVETNRYVFGPDLINEKQGTKKHPLWIECRIVGPIGTDIGSLQLLQPLLPGSGASEAAEERLSVVAIEE